MAELVVSALVLAMSVVQPTFDVVMDVSEGRGGGSYLVTVYPGLPNGINGDLNCDGDIRPADVIELSDHWIDQTIPTSCSGTPATATIMGATFPEFMVLSDFGRKAPTTAAV